MALNTMSIFQILQIRLKTTLGSSLEQLNVDQDGLVQLVVVYREETFQIEIFLSYLSCMKRNMKPSNNKKKVVVVVVVSGVVSSVGRLGETWVG